MDDSSLKFLEVGTGPNARSIAIRARAGTSPGLLWLGGFKSDMLGTNAVALDAWAADNGRAMIRFDYSGHGESGGRYFLVNSHPVRINEFAETFARLARRPLRAWRVPAAAARFMVGPILADELQTGAVFSNIRLRGIGFRFRYPTLEQGLQQILGALDE